MKRLVLLLAFLCCLPLTSRADDASKRAKAQEMFTILHMDRLMSQMMDNILKQTSRMTEQMGGANLTAADKAKMDDFQARIFKLVDTQIGWKAMEPAYTDLYAQTYTEEELDGILAFYKSPVGTSMLAKTPELSAKSMQLVQAKMTALQPQLMQMIQDFAKSAQPAPPSTPPAGPAKQ